MSRNIAMILEERIGNGEEPHSAFVAYFHTVDRLLPEEQWLVDKDDLLRSLCSEIFYHVFTDLLPQEVPEDFLIHHLAGSFAETVKWWASKNMEPAPETVAGYYMAVAKR